MSEVICPCDVFEHPRRISNPPGLQAIDYRIADYAAFRQALLRARPGERALADWQPGAENDLALQLLEWWAYLADVLVFYNERALQEVLLRTAIFPEDVRRIIRLLGYRPRPGIGATGVVAALVDSPRPFTVPTGFPIQGSMPVGKPQVFEVDRDVEVGLLGKPLPPSARFPQRSDLVTSWTGYADRDESGNLRNAIPARPKKNRKLPQITAGTPVKLAIKGLVTNVGPDDTVLILKRGWDNETAGRALAVVHELSAQWDEQGLPVTVLTLHPGHTLPAGLDRDDFQVLKATKMSHLWLYHERYPGNKSPSLGGFIAQAAEQFFDPLGLFSGGVAKEPPQDPHALTSSTFEKPGEGAAHLEAITRGIAPGDPVLFEQKLAFPSGFVTLFAQMIGAGATLPTLATKLDTELAYLTKVTGYSELIWYANPPESDRIGQGPPIGPPSHGLISSGASPIPIPHSKITFFDPGSIASGMSNDDLNIKTIVVHYGWQEVGQMVDVPATGATTEPEVPGHPAVPGDQPLPVVIEDATGAGVPSWIGVPPTEPTPPLVGPLRALLNLLPVSRGQTVEREVLGSGSSIAINQELTLASSPLTYLTDPRAPTGFRSTLRIWVDGIEWHEVPSFFEQPPDARVFVTREDDQQRTTVRFGDGELGARLPTGIDNIVATYRHGSGAAVPPIGALTTMLKPQKGLQTIRNPIQPGGGADPDPPEQIRRYAPRSVLAFGRAISGDDYETIAAQTPAVRRAKVVWGWDPEAQRSLVKVFVGDDDAAVRAARDALRAFSDPNRPIMVAAARPVEIDLSLTLEIDRDYDAREVEAAVAATLLDPDRPPFGIDAVAIDDVVYDSQIFEACLNVRGVIAVHRLQLRRRGVSYGASPPPRPPLPPPGFCAQFPIWSSSIALSPLPPAELWHLDAGERHGTGEGRYFLLQADRLHISTEVWRHGR